MDCFVLYVVLGDICQSILHTASVGVGSHNNAIDLKIKPDNQFTCVPDKKKHLSIPKQILYLNEVPLFTKEHNQFQWLLVNLCRKSCTQDRHY